MDSYFTRFQLGEAQKAVFTDQLGLASIEDFKMANTQGKPPAEWLTDTAAILPEGPLKTTLAEFARDNDGPVLQFLRAVFAATITLRPPSMPIQLIKSNITPGQPPK